MAGRISRPVIGATVGAVAASVIVSTIVLYHPIMRIPDDVKDVISGFLTAGFSLLGGMFEHRRMERAADKALREAERRDKKGEE